MPPRIVSQTPESIIVQREDGTQVEIPLNAGVNVGEIPMPTPVELPSLPTMGEWAPQLAPPPVSPVPGDVPLDQVAPLAQTPVPQQALPAGTVPQSQTAPSVTPLPASAPPVPTERLGVGVSRGGFDANRYGEVKQLIPLESDTNALLATETPRTAREQQLLSPYETALTAQSSAAGSLANAQSGVELATAAGNTLLSESAKSLAKSQEEFNARVAERQNALMTEFNSVRQEVAAQEAKGVDRSRWWSNASTGKKLAVALAAFMDGFLKPTTGGTGAIGVILNAVDKDVEDQLTNIRLSKGRLGDLQNQMGALLDFTKSDALLREQLKALMLESVAREADAMVATSKSPVRQAEGQALKAGLLGELAKINQGVQEQINQEAVRDEQLRQGRQGLSIERGRLALSRESLNFQREQERNKLLGKMLEVENPKTIVNPIGGGGKVIGTVRGTFVDDPKVVRDIQQKVVNYVQYRDAASRYRQALQEAGKVVFKGKTLGEQKTRELLSLHADLQDVIARERTGAAMPQSEKATYDLIIPPPATYLQRSEPIGQLDQRLITEDRNILAEIGGVVDITNPENLPTVTYQAKDAAVPVEDGALDISGVVNNINALVKEVKSGPSVDLAVEQELRDYVKAIVPVVSSDPDALYTAQYALQKVPKKYRTITSPDSRVGTVDALEYLRGLEKKRLTNTKEDEEVRFRKFIESGGREGLE